MKKNRDPLDCFQRIVSLLYREIGILKPHNHQSVSAKAKRSAQFFTDRKGEARRIYQETRHMKDPLTILEAYHTRTGLTLSDIRQAFAEGNWQGPSGTVFYGGPKWALVAEFAQDLQHAIESEDGPKQDALVSAVDTLQHNTGRIVDKFSQLD